MDEPATRDRPDPDVEALLGLDGVRGGSVLATLRPGRGRVRLVAAIVAALLGVAFLRWTFSESSPPLQFVLDEARRTDLTVVVTATGSVQPTEQVDLSSELSGIVRSVHVDDNSLVKVGQCLAELDTDKLEATVASSRARLAAAEARVAEAKATILEQELEYQRAFALVAKRVGSERDLEVAEAAYDRAVASLASARAEVEAARANLELDRTNLAKACIASPIDGVVLQRNVEPGQTVASSFQAPVLFVLARNLESMEIQVDVDEADVGLVREGQSATFTVDAYPERPFEARIEQLRFGSEVVQGVVTYKAVLSAANSELLLRPGMTATAEITIEHLEDVLSVPNEALRFTPPAEGQADPRGFLQRLLPGRPRFREPSAQEPVGSERRVFVLRDGRPASVPVRIGASDGRRTRILEGALEAGEQVIVDAVQAGG